ncbi:hypothetical protein DMUE_1935 [Dictyocoela muelleri]|nr:hypothetical protein DMUE_1935 [Dictyocoela muelleri]
MVEINIKKFKICLIILLTFPFFRKCSTTKVQVHHDPTLETLIRASSKLSNIIDDQRDTKKKNNQEIEQTNQNEKFKDQEEHKDGNTQDQSDRDLSNTPVCSQRLKILSLEKKSDPKKMKNNNSGMCSEKLSVPYDEDSSIIGIKTDTNIIDNDQSLDHFIKKISDGLAQLNTTDVAISGKVYSEFGKDENLKSLSSKQNFDKESDELRNSEVLEFENKINPKFTKKVQENAEIGNEFMINSPNTSSYVNPYGQTIVNNRKSIILNNRKSQVSQKICHKCSFDLNSDTDDYYESIFSKNSENNIINDTETSKSFEYNTIINNLKEKNSYQKNMILEELDKIKKKKRKTTWTGNKKNANNLMMTDIIDYFSDILISDFQENIVKFENNRIYSFYIFKSHVKCKIFTENFLKGKFLFVEKTISYENIYKSIFYRDNPGQKTKLKPNHRFIFYSDVDLEFFDVNAIWNFYQHVLSRRSGKINYIVIHISKDPDSDMENGELYDNYYTFKDHSKYLQKKELSLLTNIQTSDAKMPGCCKWLYHLYFNYNNDTFYIKYTTPVFSISLKSKNLMNKISQLEMKFSNIVSKEKFNFVFHFKKFTFEKIIIKSEKIKSEKVYFHDFLIKNIFTSIKGLNEHPFAKIKWQVMRSFYDNPEIFIGSNIKKVCFPSRLKAQVLDLNILKILYERLKKILGTEDGDTLVIMKPSICVDKKIYLDIFMDCKGSDKFIFRDIFPGDDGFYDNYLNLIVIGENKRGFKNEIYLLVTENKSVFIAYDYPFRTVLGASVHDKILKNL